jgi:hypothetical protein
MMKWGNPPNEKVVGIEAGAPNPKIPNQCHISISSYAERMIYASKPKYPRQNCNLFHYHVWFGRCFYAGM